MNVTLMVKWLSSHRVVSGALAGVASGLTVGLINAPFLTLLAAPFISGVVGGSVKNGAKAGILTLVLGLLVGVPASAALLSSGVLPRPNVSGVGIVDSTLAALTNGILGSAYATMGGFAALFSQLGQIMAFLALASIAFIAGVGMVASAIAGALGGLLGSIVKIF